jgi:hypothetical protein
LAITVSPTLFLFDRISAVVAAVRLVPAARLALELGGVVGAGVDAVAGAGVVVLGDVVGRVLDRAGVRGAGAAVGVAAGRSFSSAVVSTGASWRSRFRLSAVAVCSRSARPHAARAAKVSAAISVLDIEASLM